MAITATFYTFSKKKNSTARPSGGTNRSIYIKDPSSVLNPRIELSGSNPYAGNYCYISSFDRYYFVSDWISDHGMWQASLTVDVLASWRSSIMASSQYVARSGSKKNSYIIDSAYPMTNEITFDTYDFATKPFNTLRYIIGIANGHSSDKVGGLEYYNLNAGEVMLNLFPKLLGNVSYLGSEAAFGLTDTIMKALVNPLQYIGECYILPYDIGGNTLDNLYAGWWMVDTDYGYPILTNNDLLTRHLIKSYTNIVLPHHPQRLLGEYLDGEPYRRMRLDAGPFGIIPLDSTLIANCSSIDINIYGDFKGNCEMQISDHVNGDIIARYYANVAIPVSITQIGNSPSSIVGTATGVTELAAGTISVNPAGVIDGAIHSIKSSEGFLFPQAQGHASVGSLDAILEDWRVVCEFHHIVDTEPGILGSPLCENVILNTISGYTQLVDPVVNWACYESEHDQLVSILTSGFYLE